MRLWITAALAACLSGPAAAETIVIGVNGMVCAFCVNGIETTFKKQPEVETVTVDLDAKTVSVVTRQDMTLDDAAIARLIAEAGYTPVAVCRDEHGRAKMGDPVCKPVATAS
ncbi:MAG: heavy-metal-associated domain-containing protein [Hyphomicrobiales bacterium]|nr:heavy-metal-associated domain-containing protein [Hyphomicrobiales bacterium]